MGTGAGPGLVLWYGMAIGGRYIGENRTSFWPVRVCALCVFYSHFAMFITKSYINVNCISNYCILTSTNYNILLNIYIIYNSTNLFIKYSSQLEEWMKLYSVQSRD